MGQGQSNAPISTVSAPTDDGITWWCRISAKAICVIGGLGEKSIIVFFLLLNCLNLMCPVLSILFVDSCVVLLDLRYPDAREYSHALLRSYNVYFVNRDNESTYQYNLLQGFNI